MIITIKDYHSLSAYYYVSGPCTKCFKNDVPLTIHTNLQDFHFTDNQMGTWAAGVGVPAALPSKAYAPLHYFKLINKESQTWDMNPKCVTPNSVPYDISPTQVKSQVPLSQSRPLFQRQH